MWQGAARRLSGRRTTALILGEVRHLRGQSSLYSRRRWPCRCAATVCRQLPAAEPPHAALQSRVCAFRHL